MSDLRALKILARIDSKKNTGTVRPEPVEGPPRSGVRNLPYANERWFQLLKAAIEAKGSSVAAVARKLGYGRPAISQVYNGIYLGKPDKIAAKVLEIMDRWPCPYLNTEIVAEDCRSIHEGPTPSHDPARLAQRRMCKTCKHNSKGGNTHA